MFFTPGYNAPLGCPSPFGFTLHDLNPVCVPENSNSAKRAYYQYVVRPACLKAVFVLTVSEYSKQAICEWAKVRDEKVVCVGNGVGWPFHAGGRRYEPGCPYLLYVGNRKPHKNLGRLLKAYAISGVRRSLRLVLTGTRDLEISAQLEALSLGGDVRFVDPARDEDLASLYRGAEALLFPSTHEGFGLPLFEAMACGTPVLTSNVCSLPEVAGDAALLVYPFEVESIAEGIKRLADDEALRCELRLKGLARAGLFSWEATARKTRGVLKSAGAGKG